MKNDVLFKSYYVVALILTTYIVIWICRRCCRNSTEYGEEDLSGEVVEMVEAGTIRSVGSDMGSNKQQHVSGKEDFYREVYWQWYNDEEEREREGSFV